MSAPVSDAALRELGARVRVFRNLTEVLRWWRDQQAKRLPHAIDNAAIGCPTSAEAIDETNATFAAITSCLGKHHRADREDWAMSEWRIGALAHWLASEELGQTAMAKQLGWQMRVAQDFMQETVDVLTNRLRARGLLEARP